MRKLILLVFLVLPLTIFNSCNEDEEYFLDVKENDYSVEKFVNRHIELCIDVTNIFKNDENINFKIIQNLYKYNITSEYDLELKLIEAGVTKPLELIQILKDQEVNYLKFLEKNDSFKQLSSNEKINYLENELNQTFDSPEYSTSARSCWEQWDIDTDRCNRNYVLGAVGSLAVGIVSGGWGGLVAYASTTAAYGYCLADAEEDYYDCIEDE